MLEGDFSEDSLDGLDHRPPPLHQQDGFDCFGRDASPPVYRSLCAFSSHSFSEVDDLPVYRSISSCFAPHEDALGVGACAGLTGPAPAPVPLPPAGFAFELFGELFDLVLAHLPSHPHLFRAAAVSRQWREAASANYARRTQLVPAAQDALLRAAAAASPGDTLLLQPGLHWLSAELLVDKPLRLHSAAPGEPTVLATRCAALLRTRSNSLLRGLTLLRMGEEEGYPNAVIVAETGLLRVDQCRITCGGSAPSVDAALGGIAGAPAPGQAWPLDRLPPAEPPHGPNATPVQDPLQQQQQQQPRGGPQSGVWVGPGAHVKLAGNTIARCSGPGIKIYKGVLEAVGNTVAFSRCGANVVANSGRVTLRENAIHGAVGDGVSSWNKSRVSMERNWVHSNQGTGVTINQGGSVTIEGNCFAHNLHTAVQFATANVKRAQISNNDWSQNAAGGCLGLVPSMLQDAGRGATPMDVEQDSGGGPSKSTESNKSVELP